VVPHAISGVELALWDLIGNALGMPVYQAARPSRASPPTAWASMHAARMGNDGNIVCRCQSRDPPRAPSGPRTRHRAARWRGVALQQVPRPNEILSSRKAAL
jgi:L-alanine-DL-glutamate epimerase-like enolase superfamily enzyme